MPGSCSLRAVSRSSAHLEKAGFWLAAGDAQPWALWIKGTLQGLRFDPGALCLANAGTDGITTCTVCTTDPLRKRSNRQQDGGKISRGWPRHLGREAILAKRALTSHPAQTRATRRRASTRLPGQVRIKETTSAALFLRWGFCSVLLCGKLGMARALLFGNLESDAITPHRNLQHLTRESHLRQSPRCPTEILATAARVRQTHSAVLACPLAQTGVITMPSWCCGDALWATKMAERSRV